MQNYNIKTAHQLKDHILERLGAPIINIEVTESQIFQCIQRALEAYGEYHYNGLNKTYMAFHVGDDETYKHGVFDLRNENVFAVTGIVQKTAGTLLTMDGTGVYTWFTDFVLGLTKFNGAGGCGKSYGPNAFGADLGYFTMLDQHWSMLRKMFDPLPDYAYNDSTGQLKIMGNFKKGDTIICEVYVKSYVDVGPSVGAYAGYGFAGTPDQNSWGLGDVYQNADRQLTGYRAGMDSSLGQGAFNNRWVKDYATTLVKEINGQVLAKHQGMQLPGGVTIDGIRLLEEVRIEKENLMEELYLLDPPCPILIG